MSKRRSFFWREIVKYVAFLQLLSLNGIAWAAKSKKAEMLTGEIQDIWEKVSSLSDILMYLGAFGAILGLGVTGIKLTMGGWSTENLRKCKTSVIVVMLGLLLVVSSRVMVGIVYNAVK
ncbi:hypothetical protein [Carboxydocella sp. JDF658]|uniref:hypothetical protein n=1 Tax=Carboxydocella sp. JDF658 TaxID=1926600 RepID=UPI0009ADF645|nr:hypothetical protein [Carboxydocella sp. JDF658]GAW32711.1 hypothetical protein JDF658_24760 [Carboxydocella sp. JDF658]